MIQEPRFTISKKKVLEQYNKLKNAGFKISYSLKTNPIVGTILEKETDSWFSVHLTNELKHLKDFSRVMYLAQGWDEEELDELFKKGINKFVVDNETDLNTLLNYLEKNNKKIILFLRMKLKEMTIHTGRYFVFGMYSQRINELVKKLKDNKNIEKLGIHVHRKTQNVSEWSLKYEMEQSLAEETLKNIDYFCLGGGMPVKYKNISDKSIEYVLKKMKEFKEWLEQHNIEAIAEPGRYISGPPTKLVTYVKNVIENNIIINASVYNASMDTIIVPIKLLVEGELEEGPIENKFTIKGITPCSMDIFRYKVFLKNRPKRGDKIVFLNAGAYTFTTDFCDLNKIETEIVEDL